MSEKKEKNPDMSAKIAAWKKEHGEVFKISVTDPADESKVYTCYVKKPSKNHLAAAAPYLQSNPVKAGDILVSNCMLQADPEITAKDECSMALNLRMFELFKIATTEVEKL